MDFVREIVVPANMLRETDYVPLGGWIVDIKKSRTTGLFPKSYITLTFYTGGKYVEFTTEAHMPFHIERVYELVARAKEQKK